MPTATLPAYQPQRTPDRVSKSHRLRQWRQSQSQSAHSAGRLGALPKQENASPDSVLNHPGVTTPIRDDCDSSTKLRRRLIANTRPASSNVSTASRGTNSLTRSSSSKKLLTNKNSHTNTSLPPKKVLPTIFELCRAILPLQNCVRIYLAKRTVRRRWNALRKLQSILRKFVAHKEYKRIKRGMLGLQSLHRESVARHSYQQLRHVQRIAVITLQQCWRVYYTQKCVGVIQIQSCYRAFRERHQYQTAKRGVSLFHTLLRQRNAVRRIQSHYRRYSSVQRYRMVVQRVMKCQSILRQWMACRSVQRRRRELICAADRIGAAWRGMVMRRDYILTVGDLILVQSIIRRRLSILRVNRLQVEQCQREANATVIQSQWRSYSTLVGYIQTRLDIVLVQSAVRKWIACNKTKEKQLSIQNGAATKISSSWRGFICCSEYRQTLEDIILCQSIVRRNKAAAQTKVIHQEKQINSATLIQSHWRTRTMMDIYILTLVDIVLVKSLARRLAARRYLDQRREERVRADAATKISSAWRRFYCLELFQCIVGDIIICQSIFRRNVAMQQTQWLLHTRHEEACASFIQEIWRAYVDRERFVRVVSNIDRSKESKSATEIARAWKTWTAQSSHGSAVRDATLCQTVIRQNLKTKEVHFFKVRVCNTAAVIIQSRWRSWVTRQHYRHCIQCIISLQCAVRKFCACKLLLRLKFAKLMRGVGPEEVESATKIAAIWRGVDCRNRHALAVEASKNMDQMRHNSICNIQAAWRDYVTKKDFSQTVSNIVLIQSLVRMVDAQRCCRYLREVNVEVSEAATKIASFVKCSLSVTKQKTEVISNMQSIRETESKASTDISKSWRKAKCMWGYKQTISAIITCQSVARSSLAKNQTKSLLLTTSAIRIQSKWRALAAALRFAHMKKKAILIQSVLRRSISSRHVNALKAVRRLRLSATATAIATSWRRHYCQREFQKAVKDIITCQAIARGSLAIKSVQVRRENGAAENEYVDVLPETLEDDIIPNTRAIITTETTESKVQPHSMEQEVTAAKIQSSFRRALCRAQWLYVMERIIVCQSVIRRWRAIELARELRCYKNQGPKDIFEFIKTRLSATTKIQETYQDYSKRNFELAYQEYLARLNKSLDESNTNTIASPKSDVENLDISARDPTVQQSTDQIGILNADDLEDLRLVEEVVETTPVKVTEESNMVVILDEVTNDLLVVEEMAEQNPANSTSKEGVVLKAGVTFEEDQNITYIIQDQDSDDANLESQCFDGSRCGLSDGVHEILMHSGKFLYDCIGDPTNEETAEDLLTVMELGEEAAFCCWKKKTPARKPDDDEEEEIPEEGNQASATIIQSKWRSFQLRKANSSKNSKQNFIESCVADKHLPPLKQYSSPARKRVAKTGQIETLLNEQNGEDDSLTDYCETESSIDGMSDVGDGLGDYETNPLDILAGMQSVSKMHVGASPGMLEFESGENMTGFSSAQ